MPDLIAIVILTVIVILCASSVIWDHRHGELCECTGKCDNCKIKCCSNERIYGSAAADLPQIHRGTIVRQDGRLSIALCKVRHVIDLVCYWIFSLCAIAALARGVYLGVARLLGSW